MRSPTPSTAIAPGFSRPSWDSQAVFRRVLEAMSHPGRITELALELEAPAPLQVATAAACLALLDYETTLWLPSGADLRGVEAYLRFHCGCPVTDAPGKADFALILNPNGAPALETFAQGSAEQPHRSATVILQVESLTTGTPVTLRGPGIATEQSFRPAGLPAQFWTQWQRNAARFPLGVDVIFACGAQLAALPRTIHAEG
jgi:alpha-D-ribose 1-methylphosphonate 5-triphosphate synthase subunit PhnH